MMYINSQQHYDSAVDYDSRYDAASDLMHTDERKEPMYDATNFKSNAMPRKTHLTVNVHMQQQKQPDIHTASTQYSDYSSNTGSSNEVFSGHSDSSILANTSNPLPHHQLQLSIPAETVQPKRIQRKRPTPKKFKFDSNDFLKSANTPATIRNIPHWTHFPEPKDFRLADRYAIKQLIGKLQAMYVEQQLEELQLQQQKQKQMQMQHYQQQQQMMQQSMQRTAIASNDEKFTLKMPSLQSRKYEDSDLQRQTTERFNALHAQHQQKQLTTPSLPHIAASHISTSHQHVNNSVSVPSSPVTQAKPQPSIVQPPSILYSQSRRLVVQNTIPAVHQQAFLAGTISAPVSPSSKQVRPSPPAKPSASSKQAAVYRYEQQPHHQHTGSYSAKMLDSSAIGQGVVTHQPHITLTGTKMSGLKSLPASPNQGHKRSRSLQRAVTLNTTHIAEYNRTQPLKLASNSHDRDMAVDSFSSLNLAKKQHDAHSRSDTNIYSAGNSRPTTPTSSLSRFLNRIKNSLMESGSSTGVVTKRATVR